MQTGASSETLAATRRIGAYRLLDVLGEGGMGIVYRAEHAQTRQPVALKTVSVRHERQLESLRREIFALRRIQHPGVVRILDEGIEAGAPWYAMELLEGETLSEYNRRNWQVEPAPYPDEQETKLESHTEPRGQGQAMDEVPELQRRPVAAGRLEHALALVQRLCESLAFLHGEGIVHRDLKSANVFLRRDDQPVLIDFGLVWRFPSSLGREVLDVASGLAGTAGYMAPEQIAGGTVDARADIYAVGCILYELLTGRLPYRNEPLVQKLTMAPLPPSRLVSGVPLGLDALVMRLLERRPRDRIGHAADVVYAIEALRSAESGPVTRRSVSPRPYVYRPEMTGRDEVLSQITSRLKSLENGRGDCLLVRGESGIGKTCVAMAVGRMAETFGFQVIAGSGAPLASAELGRPNESPLHPFGRFFEAIVDRCLGQSTELVERLLGGRGPILAPYEPRFAALPGYDDAPPLPDLPAQAARERLFEALSATLGAYADERPALLILDDLHWADELSLRFVAWLDAAFFERHPLLILGTYRTEEIGETLAALTARPHVKQMALAPLSATTLAAIASDMLSLEMPPPPFVRALADKAEGNPFFAGEYVRAAVEGGLLKRDSGGRWRVIDAAMDLPLPGTLQELVRRRIDGLSPEARGLLEIASVVGRNVDVDFLAALSDAPAGTQRGAARELLARQILEEIEPGQLRFLHDKLREHTYQQMDRDHRRATHLRTARALEARAAADHNLPQLFAQLAHHYSQTDEHDKSVEYLEKAAETALASFANRETIELLERAIAIDDLRKAGDGQALRRARWERQLAEARYGLGDLDAVLTHGRRALAWLGEGEPRSAPGWLGQVCWNALVQVAHGLRPDSIALQPGPERDRAREASIATQRLAVRYYFNFDALPMIGASLRSVNLAERAGADVSAATTYGVLGMSLGLSKLEALGNHYDRAARRVARATGDRTGLVFALYARAAWRIGDGAWDEVRSLCREALDAAREGGATPDPQDRGIIETLLAHCEFYEGRFESSREAYEKLAASARARGNEQHLAWGLYAAGRALIPLGRLEQSRVMLEEANALLERGNDVPSRIICPGLLATVHLAQGDRPAAARYADVAEARIRNNLPTVFATVAGYASVVEVRLDDWQQAIRLGGDRSAAAQRVLRAVLGLGSLALNIPIGRPYYHRLRGRALGVAGLGRAARGALRAAIRSAARLGMPYEEALAHAELAALEPRGSRARAAERRLAQALFDRLQCPADLARLRDLAD